MESKHDGLEDDVPFQTPVFQVSCWFVGDYALFLFWKVWWWCLQRWWSANTVVVLAASLGTRGFLVQVVELQNTYFWENTCICSLDVYIYDIISNIDNNAILYIYIYTYVFLWNIHYSCRCVKLHLHVGSASRGKPLTFERGNAMKEWRTYCWWKKSQTTTWELCQTDK